MQNILLVILIILVLTLFSVIYFLSKKTQELMKPKDEDKNLFQMLQNQILDQSRSVQELSRALDSKINESNRFMSQSQQNMNITLQEQFGQSTRMIQGITGQSAKMIAEITEKLTSLDQTNKQVIGFSEQLSNLEKTLTHQKKRGNLGEAGLQLVLENILPPTAYELQHQFADGDIVDAVVKTRDGLIPVDAKFSLDNYNRVTQEKNEQLREQLEKDFKNDLKKRIDETSKYIKPNQGTLEFAFMFIPAEGIYYDLLVNEVGAVKSNTRSLIEYAMREKKVIIVSPTTFSAYLHTVLQGLRAMKIEESAQSIRKNVESLHKHIQAYEEYMKKLGNSLSTTVNHYNNAYKELEKMDKDVVKITEGDKVIDTMQIDKPTQQE